MKKKEVGLEVGGCVGEVVSMSTICRIRICITINAAAAICNYHHRAVAYRIIFVIGGPVLGFYTFDYRLSTVDHFYEVHIELVECFITFDESFVKNVQCFI